MINNYNLHLTDTHPCHVKFGDVPLGLDRRWC